jgi:hypothetical protein
MAHKEVEAIIRQLRKRDDCRVEDRAKKYLIFGPPGTKSFAISKTPGVSKAIEAIHADLRRIGIDLGDRRS